MILVENHDKRLRISPGGYRGAVALELVVVVPVLVFSLMFIVHVGESLSAAVLLHQAANAAARSAAESARSSANATALVSGVTTVANTVLAAGGISSDSSGPGAWCDAHMQVVVQERVSNPTGSEDVGGYEFILSAPPASEIPVETIRVTLFVRQSEMVPDLLSGFGFSMTGKYLQASVLQPWNGSP